MSPASKPGKPGKSAPGAAARAAETPPPHYLGHRQRLREKLVAEPKALADYELLELLLGQVLPRRDTKPLAKALMARFSTLRAVLTLRARASPPTRTPTAIKSGDLTHPEGGLVVWDQMTLMNPRIFKLSTNSTLKDCSSQTKVQNL